MSATDTEKSILESVRSNLVAEGYDVIIHPSPLQLPLFLKHTRPDAIATRGANDNLLIEVVSRSPSSADKLAKLRDAIAGENGWSLRTVWTSSHTVPARLPPPSKRAVIERLATIHGLLANRQFDAALLISWATLEGCARALLEKRIDRPQTPGRLVEQLEAFGEIGRDDARFLRQLGRVRNRLVHGDLDLHVSELEAVRLFVIVEGLKEKM